MSGLGAQGLREGMIAGGATAPAEGLAIMIVAWGMVMVMVGTTGGRILGMLGPRTTAGLQYQAGVGVMDTKVGLVLGEEMPTVHP